jgi:hypothetical protein
MGPVTALKGPIVVGSSILVGGLEEITVSLHGVWCALCLYTAPTEISTRKGCELWDTSLSPRASVISLPELLYLCNLLYDSLRA